MGALSTTFKAAGKVLGFGVSNPIKTGIGATAAADVVSGQGIGTTAGSLIPKAIDTGQVAATNFIAGATGAAGTAGVQDPTVSSDPNTLNLGTQFNQNANPIAGLMQSMGAAFGNNPGAAIGAALGALSGDGIMGRIVGMILGAVLGGVIGKFAGPALNGLMNNDGPQSGTSAQFNPAAFGLPAGPAPAALQADIEQQPKPAPLAFTPAG
ncbi:hypothetical protein [Micavibrio aeruginosavorus]|uniref:hypothetical protein n=1 Tax=Micavibrio aeruginosavorus TaxID=349221 RepID=UPI003F4AAE47